MPRQTEIIIGGVRGLRDAEAAVRTLLQLTGADEVSIVSQSKEWCEDDEDGTLLGYDLQAVDVPSLHRAGNCLDIDVGGCPLAKSLGSALIASVDPDQLDEFHVNGVFVRVGGHIVTRFDEYDEEIVVGRYSASLTIWGYGTPSDPDEVLAAMRRLAEFADVLSPFEAQCGPAEVTLVMRV